MLEKENILCACARRNFVRCPRDKSSVLLIHILRSSWLTVYWAAWFHLLRFPFVTVNNQNSETVKWHDTIRWCCRVLAGVSWTSWTAELSGSFLKCRKTPHSEILFPISGIFLGGDCVWQLPPIFVLWSQGGRAPSSPATHNLYSALEI